MSAIGEALQTALRRVSEEVLEQARQGLGREVVGAVPGRPESEDVEIGIDSRCDEILVESLSEAGVAARVYSEHGSNLVGGGEPEYIVTVDPFDGSGLYRRGIPAEWWSVASYFDGEGTPLGGAAVDILRGELYAADADGVTVGPVNREMREPVSPSDKKSLGSDVTLSAYLMQPSYITEWSARTREMMGKYPGLRVWPNGGACIYPWLARGRVDAYLMFDEPRSEVDPGLGFAARSGVMVFEAGSNGSLNEYRFSSKDRAGRAALFVAACTTELAQNIVAELT